MPTSKTGGSTTCPGSVRALLERFAEHADAYKQQTYNETQVRREFIDPFFEALGWDVDNKAGHAEAYGDCRGVHVHVTDRQIDQLVYELYGLSDAEIRIVEEATK